MSVRGVKNVIVISDDEEDKSVKKDNLTDSLGSDRPSTSNKQPEVNKKLKITVEQNQSTQNSTKVVIEIDDLPSSQETAQERRHTVFLEELKDEGFTLEFLQLIELCLKYECSDGMTRILKRNLIPNYKSANRAYVESLAFQKVLENSLSNLQKQPQYKFSTIKCICEVLKYNKVKKRVNFVTLDKKISEKRKAQYNSEVQQKKPNIEVIDLDDTDSLLSTTAIIDVDSLENDDVQIIDNDKENYEQNDDVQIINDEESYKMSSQQNNIQSLEKIPEDIPRKGLGAPSPQKINKAMMIERIEKEIEELKQRIKVFDELEVLDDSTASPYICNDRFQASIVALYKELCRLKGVSAVPRKCTGIQLAVPVGQPSGPARTLQQFMNEQILNGDGEDPPFPDFVDVIKCVTKASVEDKLFWGKPRILATAQLLFIQIGVALQERRKRREWRDLCRRVEGPDEDPADEDPELLARLEANRELAERKERDILDHFAKLETETKVKKKIIVLARKTDLEGQNSLETRRTDFMLEFEVPPLIQQTTDENEHTDMDVKPIITPKPIDPHIEIEISDSEDYSSSENELSDFELDDVVPKTNEAASLVATTAATNVLPGILKNDDKSTELPKSEAVKQPRNTNNQVTEEAGLDNGGNIETKIKSEQEDETLKFLLELDRNKDEAFTIKTSIFDLEEPVVFIEISSSSESESENEDVCDEENRDVTTDDNSNICEVIVHF